MQKKYKCIAVVVYALYEYKAKKGLGLLLAFLTWVATCPPRDRSFLRVTKSLLLKPIIFFISWLESSPPGDSSLFFGIKFVPWAHFNH